VRDLASGNVVYRGVLAVADTMPGLHVLIRAGDGPLLLYVPRQRFWAKMTGDRTYLAGVAGRLVSLCPEMAKLGAEAGSLDALQEEEQDGRS
jgi:hypothetical protein